MPNELRPIHLKTRPAPGGHYSPAVLAGDLLFTSGQLPTLTDGSHALAAEDFETQARQAFDNLTAVLKAGGATLASVVKTTIYISDMADWPSCNAIYAEHFGDWRPARSVVPVGILHFGYRIEVEAIARRIAPPAH